MKRRLVIAECVLVVVVVCSACWLIKPFWTIRRLDGAYARVERGMTVEQVEALMGSGGSWKEGASTAYWDDAVLEPGESARIRRALSYTVSTFYLPVRFEFAFDEAGRLVGRHRYD